MDDGKSMTKATDWIEVKPQPKQSSTTQQGKSSLKIDVGISYGKPASMLAYMLSPMSFSATHPEGPPTDHLSISDPNPNRLGSVRPSCNAIGFYHFY